jgi:hypothetical protein
LQSRWRTCACTARSSKTHADKWPDWKPSADSEHSEAFNDLCRSAIKIVAEIFSMLDESDQMQFMRNVMVAQEVDKLAEGKNNKTLQEVLEKVKVALNGPTKH